MNEKQPNAKGQAIIIMAFAVIALAAMVGLAIDGGNLYATRRHAQNGADAIALAGAQVLADYISGCVTEVDLLKDGNGDVYDAIVEYAHFNKIEIATDNPNVDVKAWYVDKDGDPIFYADGSWGVRDGEVPIPDHATGVAARVVLTETTSFMKLFGFRHISAPANATAMVGVIDRLPGGAGLLPIAVPLEVVEALNPNEHFYVMENNQHHGGQFCRDEDGDMCIGDPTSANAHRGWLNLNFIYNTAHRAADDPLNRSFETNVPNRPCGNDPTKSVDDGLQGWAGDDKDGDGESDCPYPFTVISGGVGHTDGDFIHGDPGARQSSLHDVISTYNGKIAIVPIFDHIYMSDYMDDNFPGPEEPPDGSLGGKPWPRAGGGGHAFLYHIVGFAAVRIDDGKWNDHILEANFQEYTLGQMSDLTPSDGIGGTCDITIKALALWE